MLVLIEGDSEENFTHLIINGCLPEVRNMIEQSMIPQEWLEKECYIYWASICGHIEIVKELLKIGADVNKPKHILHADTDLAYNKSPLHAAAEQGYTETVKVLLEYGANVNAVLLDEVLHITPLHEAAKFGHLEIIKLLLENGAIVNANLQGYTPLFYAAIHGTSLEVIEYLLKSGANPNLTDDGGNTLLHQICNLHSFLRKEKNLNAFDEDNFDTPKLDFIPILIAYGADLKARNKENISVLDISIKYNNLQLTKILLPYHQPKSEIFHSVYPLDKFLHSFNVK